VLDGGQVRSVNADAGDLDDLRTLNTRALRSLRGVALGSGVGEGQQRAAGARHRAVHRGVSRLRGGRVKPRGAQQRSGLVGSMPAGSGPDRQHPAAAQTLRYRHDRLLITQDPLKRPGLAVHRLAHRAHRWPASGHGASLPDQADHQQPRSSHLAARTEPEDPAAGDERT
jgi:hypothetical protein